MIKLDKITAGYEDHVVLQELSASFEKGSLTSIIGINGCGKSTLLKTILNMVPLQGGDVNIDGTSLQSMSRKTIAQKVAYLSQEKSIPDMTVEQMVLHGRFPYLSYPRRYTAQDREIVIQAMKQMGITAFAQKRLQTLSGGMRQNAYIAMALAQNTDYILMDEPTTFLDISHQLGLMKTLRNLADSGKGIITVMHDLPMAFTYCDQLLLLDGGQVITAGTPGEVCSHIEKVFGVGLESGQHYHYKYL